MYNADHEMHKGCEDHKIHKNEHCEEGATIDKLSKNEFATAPLHEVPQDRGGGE